MNIQKNISLDSWIESTLTSIRMESPPIVENKCHHCGLVMRFPLVARESDVKDFKTLIHSAYDVMERHGITANLLADIFAQCHIAIAKNKASSHELLHCRK